MGLLSGRSRHSGRGTRSERGADKTPSKTRRRVDEEPDDLPEPGPSLEELRRRRSEYYAVPPATRRRLASSSTIPRSTKRRSTASTLRTPHDKRRTHKRRHKNSSAKPESHEDESQRRTEDYVYGPRVSQTSEIPLESSARDKPEATNSTRKPTKRSSLTQRRSLPTVFEAEITPDDSISQVGVRSVAEKKERPTSSRPTIRRSKTTSSRLSPLTEASEVVASSSRSKKPARSSSLLSSLSRRHSTPSYATLPTPRLVECLTCGSDDVPSTQAAKLACGHRMCQDCLKRIFEMSVKDPQHMPPKCCTDNHIPLKHVDKLFDVKFKMLWNRKYQEYHTKNRIYCPTLKCGEWIKPSHIHTTQGRKYAKCPRCSTKVCTLCNNKLHKSSDCPEDPEIAKLVEQAKEKGWQRCYSCNALVERKEGCNHMTCRCLAEFCIVCGSKWKTCECPWFNYANLPNPDRLNDMRVPEPIQIIYRQFLNGAANQDRPQQPPAHAGNNAAADVRRRRAARRGTDLTYQQELDQRRRQERLDADLARRLQLASLMEPEDDAPARNGPNAEVFGNAVRNFMNDDFVQNAANVIMNTFGDATLGRRGERQSARRRRSAQVDQRDRDPGLAPDFLVDESVVGAGAASRPRREWI